MNIIQLTLKIRRFLAFLSEHDPARFTRQQEDLVIVLSHPAFRPLLPRVFPGISGSNTVSFETSGSVSRGNPQAMSEPISAMVRNELRVNPGKNIHRIITQILESAEALCEHGIVCESGQKTEVIGGLYTNEIERKSTLGAIIGSGPHRITVEGEQLLFHGQKLSSSSLRNEEEKKGFLQSLGEGKSLSDAALAASIVSRELVEFGHVVASVLNRNSSRKKPKRTKRSPGSRYKYRGSS